MENSYQNTATKEQQAFSTLLLYIKKEGINPATYLHTSEKTIKRIYAGKDKPSFFLIYRLKASFSKVDWNAIKKGTASISLDDDLGFQQKTAKLRFLDKFLKDKAQLTFARALSLSLHNWNNLESGYSLPSKRLLKKTATYFCLPPKMLLDDEEKLPKIEELKLDEDLVSIQRNDLSETMNYYKNKHYISRNYRVLSHPMRIKMYLSLLFILIPLLAYTAYSAYTIIEDRQSSIRKMSDNAIDETSASFQKNYIDTHTKETDASLTYCPVKIGAQVLKIFDIKPANEYFSVAMHLWFDFSQDDFHTMYKNYKDPDRNAEADNATETQKLQDVFTVNRSTNAVTFASDNIPDYIELLSPFSLKNKIDATASADTVYKKDEIISNNPSLAVVPELWKK
jgi:DNA-binding XRE family transcriptional regulator